MEISLVRIHLAPPRSRAPRNIAPRRQAASSQSSGWSTGRLAISPRMTELPSRTETFSTLVRASQACCRLSIGTWLRSDIRWLTLPFTVDLAAASHRAPPGLAGLDLATLGVPSVEGDVSILHKAGSSGGRPRPKPSAMCRRRKIKLSILGFGRFELQDTWTTLEECKDNCDEPD